MANDAQSVQLRLDSDITKIAAVAEQIEEWANNLNLSPKDIFQVNLAIDEILTNIISYGYDNKEQHEIKLELVYAQSCLMITITDDGKSFNPLDIEMPDVKAQLEDRPVGGLGFYLVSKVMDQVTYSRESGKNVLLLTKALT